MKPTRAQYFFARSWPLVLVFGFLFVAAPIWFAFVVAGILARVYQPITDIWNLPRVAFFAIVAWLLAVLVALVVASFLAGIFWPILRPRYRARCIKNGAPFRVGDQVQILVGRHRGRVATVSSGWRDDGVRVELGEREKEDFEDIYDPIQLVREDVEPNVH
jgi:hypothetical protein